MSFLIQYNLRKKGILSPENTKNWERECYDIALCVCQCGYENSRKKYFWYSQHMHFDIFIDGGPPKSVVFIIQCNELR